MVEDLYMSGFYFVSVLPAIKYTLVSFPLQSRFRVLSDVRCINSKINLIDLAGSERLSKTGVSNGRHVLVHVLGHPVINMLEVKLQVFPQQDSACNPGSVSLSGSYHSSTKGSARAISPSKKLMIFLFIP